MCQLIGNGIKNLSHSGDHVKPACNFAIDHICEAGNSKNAAGKEILTRLSCVQINDNIYRYQRNAEHTQHIGDGKNFFFPVVNEHEDSSVRVCTVVVLDYKHIIVRHFDESRRNEEC